MQSAVVPLGAEESYGRRHGHYHIRIRITIRQYIQPSANVLSMTARIDNNACRVKMSNKARPSLDLRIRRFRFRS